MTTNGSGQSSITLSTNSKGQVQPEVKVYAPTRPATILDDPFAPPLLVRPMTPAEVRDEAIELARIATVALCKAVDELASAGVPTVYSPEAVASMREFYHRIVHGKAA